MVLPVLVMVPSMLFATPGRGHSPELGTIFMDCVLLIMAMFVFTAFLRFISTLLLRLEAIAFSYLRMNRSQLSGVVFLPGEGLSLLRRSTRQVGTVGTVVIVAWTIARTGLGQVDLNAFEPVPAALTWITSSLRSRLGVSPGEGTVKSSADP